jgi:hypothetical protein
MCQSGAREVQKKVLAKNGSDKLRVFVVWTPRYPGDNRDKAVAATSLISDNRATHFWDGGGRLGRQYGKIINLPKNRTFAWDVYFVLNAQAKWEKTPPAPTEWMHQLGEDSRTLDGDRLRQATGRLLEQINQR